MQSITEAIQQLSKFSERQDVATILNGLHSLEKPSKKDETVESLRKSLNIILSDNSNTNVLLADAVYNALLALAEFMPINKHDTIDQEEIGADDRIVVSTGQQFNIINLIANHHTRNYGYQHKAGQHIILTVMISKSYI